MGFVILVVINLLVGYFLGISSLAFCSDRKFISTIAKLMLIRAKRFGKEYSDTEEE